MIETVTVDGVTFYPRHDQGAWYEVGGFGAVGELYMPMNADRDGRTVPRGL